MSDSVKNRIELINKLKEYKGKNPFILAIKRDVCIRNNSSTLSDLAIEYINKNYNLEPKQVNKIVKIADWYGNKMKEQYSLDFVPEKLSIKAYLGETSTCYHCYVKYRQNMEPMSMFISKKAVINDFLTEDYHNININFDRYDKLSMDKDVNRKLKEHQKEAIKFLLSRKKCILADDMGLGKLEPNSAIIPTPEGFKTMGNIVKGDKVFGRDGNQYNVTEVYKHKNKEIYKVTFSDGTYAECGLEHLWTVRDRNMRLRNKGWKTMSLKQLLEKGLQYSNKNRIIKGLNPINKFEIPVCEPVSYPWKDYIINPYIFGSIISGGDTSSNKSINNIELKRLGLDENKKFIPEEYKLGSIEQRIELLRGLMDSDGHISKAKNKITYTTLSEKLANDVKELIYSLGGVAKLRLYDKKYVVQIKIKFNPFKLSKKSELYIQTFKNYCAKYIVSAEYVRNEDAQCIMVDSDEHTYLTGRNYIVTHNTTSLSVASIEGNFDSILIICPASLKTNWKDELMWYVPERDVTIIDGFLDKTKPELEKFLGYGIGRSGKTVKELQEEAKSVGKWSDNRFVIVNFDILNEFYQIPVSRSKENIEKAFNNSPMLKYIANKKSLIIVDESHKLSNSTSMQYKIIKDLIKRGNPDSIYLSTGTPITNNPQNYYNLLQLIGDTITNDWNFYMERYCGAIKVPRNGEEKAKKAKISSLYISSKGKKNWYELDDNEKKELKEIVERQCKMITIYKEATNVEELRDKTSHVYLRRTKEDLKDLPNKIVHELFYSFNLQQKGEYDKLWEEYENAQLELDPEKELNKELLEGGLYRRFCSNQMVPNTIRLTEQFISRGEKVVIACCYDEELYSLKEHFGDKCVIYNGKMSAKEKDFAKNEFMTNNDKMVFIGNIISAGVGLTLISSHVLIFNNMSFVPGDNRQMEDRIYRIGQNHDVDIYYQMFKGTQYEKMWNIVLKKELTINQIIKTEVDK